MNEPRSPSSLTPSRGTELVTVYTDGACVGNPGPGGHGAVLLYRNGRQLHRREISSGFRLTTNNRMEIVAVIRALEALKRPCEVQVFSDAQYVVNALSRGWALRWKAKNWMAKPQKPRLNADLWEHLRELCSVHDVTMTWVRGHNGVVENERADELAEAAARMPGLPRDDGYEPATMGND